MLCTSFCSTYCLAQFFLLFLFNLKVLPLLFHEKGLVLTTVILLFKDARREKMNKKSYLPTCTTHGAREGVRGVAGVAMATPILQIMFHKILVLKWPKIPKVQIPQNPNIQKARLPKGPNA